MAKVISVPHVTVEDDHKAGLECAAPGDYKIIYDDTDLARYMKEDGARPELIICDFSYLDQLRHEAGDPRVSFLKDVPTVIVYGGFSPLPLNVRDDPYVVYLMPAATQCDPENFCKLVRAGDVIRAKGGIVTREAFQAVMEKLNGGGTASSQAYLNDARRPVGRDGALKYE